MMSSGFVWPSVFGPHRGDVIFVSRLVVVLTAVRGLGLGTKKQQVLTTLSH